MDVVTLGQARAQADQRYASVGHFASLTSRLQLGTEDAVWLNLGDSTGVPQGAPGSGSDMRWVYLTAQWLASQYPTVTVLHRLWNETNQNYDAATTIQTGTGARTLTVYNASISGSSVATFTPAKLALMGAVTPHVITVNLSHNDTSVGSVYRLTHYGFMRMLEDWFPRAGLVMIAQNPRTSPDTGGVNGLSRTQALIDMAGAEGYGLVNVLQAFLATPSWQTTLIQTVDGLHPSPAGSVLWSRLVQQQMTHSLLALPRFPTRRNHRISLSLGSFVAAEGTPALASVGSGTTFPAWSFDQTTQQSICTTVDVPDWWVNFNVYLAMSYAVGAGYTGSTNTARWAVGTSRHGSTGGTQSWQSPALNALLSLGGANAYSDAIGQISAVNGGAWGTSLTRIASDVSFVGRPLNLRVRRLAADAADTLAETAYLRAVILERSS